MERSYKTNAKEREKITKLLKEIKSVKKVCAIVDRGKRCVIKIAKENGIIINGSPVKPAEEEKIVLLLKQNKSPRQVAKIVNRGSTTVARIAANHKIRFHRKRKKK